MGYLVKWFDLHMYVSLVTKNDEKNTLESFYLVWQNMVSQSVDEHQVIVRFEKVMKTKELGKLIPYFFFFFFFFHLFIFI